MTQETKTFDEAYVKDLRSEAANYRVKAKELESALEAEKTKYTSFANKLLEKEIQFAAKSLNVVDPQTVSQLLDKTSFSMDEEGNFQGVEDAVKALVESKPFLKGGPIGKPSNPSNGNGQPKVFTRQEVDRMSEAEINANWKEISDQMAKGLIR